MGEHAKNEHDTGDAMNECKKKRSEELLLTRNRSREQQSEKIIRSSFNQSQFRIVNCEV